MRAVLPLQISDPYNEEFLARLVGQRRLAEVPLRSALMSFGQPSSVKQAGIGNCKIPSIIALFFSNFVGLGKRSGKGLCCILRKSSYGLEAGSQGHSI